MQNKIKTGVKIDFVFFSVWDFNVMSKRNAIWIYVGDSNLSWQQWVTIDMGYVQRDNVVF